MVTELATDRRSDSSSNAYERLLSLSVDRRIDRISDVIRHQIAETLDINSTDIGEDTPFVMLDPAWEDLRVFHAVVKDGLETILARSFYTHEFGVKPKGSEGRDTIRRLSSYLAQSLEIPTPTNTFTDPYEHGHWAWGTPDPSPDEMKRNAPAIFILTSARAGSTLLRTMLAGHPDLLVPPELNLLEFESMAKRKQMLNATGYSGFSTGLGHAIEMTGATPDETAQKLDHLEAEDASVPQVYQTLQNLAGQRMIVDKSPIYALQPTCLQRAEQIFDAPKYLHLIRHPYAMIESMVRMRFHKTVVGNHLGIWDENPWLFAEKWYAACYRNTIDFLKTIPAERQHTIYFEALVTHPEAVIAEVCTFLDIPFHPALIDPYAGDRKLEGIGDPNLRARRQIDPGLATAWQKKRPPHQLSPFTQVLAQELGYHL